MTNEISELTDKVKEFTKNRNWGQFHNPKDLAIALLLEASEVLEHFRFKTEFDKDEIAKELSDVLNIVLLFSDTLGIDIVYWFNRKLEENGEKYPIEKFYGKNQKYGDVNVDG